MNNRMLVKIFQAEKQQGVTKYHSVQQWRNVGKNDDVDGLKNLLLEPFNDHQLQICTDLVCSAAINYGKCGIIRYLIGQDVFRERITSILPRLLLHAAERGHINIVIILLNQYAEEGQESIQEVLTKKTFTDSRNNAGETSLMLAAREGHEKIVAQLIQSSLFSLDLQNNKGETALMLAAQEGHEKIVARLTQDLFADINLQNNLGETALMLAAQKGYINIVSRLLYKGATINLQNNLGKTALILAVQEGHEPIVEELTQRVSAPISLPHTASEKSSMPLVPEGFEKIEFSNSFPHDFRPDFGGIPSQSALVELDPLTRFYQNDGPWDPKHTLGPIASPHKLPSHSFLSDYRHNFGFMPFLSASSSHIGSVDFGPSTAPSDSGYGTIITNNPSEYVQDYLEETIGSINDSNFSALTIKSSQSEVNEIQHSSQSQTTSASRYKRALEKCPCCDIFLRTASDLKKHKLKHERPFHCDAAGCTGALGFTTKNSLDRHKKSFHNVYRGLSTKSYRCVVKHCQSRGKIWPRLDNFRQHVQRMHPSEDVLAIIKQSEYRQNLESMPPPSGPSSAFAPPSASIPQFPFNSSELGTTNKDRTKVGSNDTTLTVVQKESHERTAISAANKSQQLDPNKSLTEEPIKKHSKNLSKEASILAARNGQKATISELLDTYGTTYDTELTLAVNATATNDHFEACALILQENDIPRGCNLNIFDSQGRSLVHWAIERGTETLLNKLIANGASVAFSDDDGITPLVLATIVCEPPLQQNTTDSIPGWALVDLGLNYPIDYQDKAYSIIQQVSENQVISPYSDGFSLYRHVLGSIAKSLEKSDFFDMLSNPNYISLLPSWGKSIYGAHVRFVFGPQTSITIRIDRLLGFGSLEVGVQVLRTFIEVDKNRDYEEGYFRLRQLVKASGQKHRQLKSNKMLIWLFALAHKVCQHQEQRVHDLETRRYNTEGRLGCWQNAFGNPLDIDLSTETINIFNIVSSDRENIDITSDGLTFSTLRDLMDSLQIDSSTTLSYFTALRGFRGICILIGNLRTHNLPLWHVCSMEEISFLEGDPDRFVGFLEETRKRFGAVPAPIPSTSELDTSDKGIMVGALIKPGWTKDIDCSGLFQAEIDGVKAGRDQLNTPSRKLQWDKISGQAQISMGAQGPQGSLTVGGEASRVKVSEALLAEASLSQDITTLERSSKSWVLVYQTTTGEVVEQNLYCLVRCVLKLKLPEMSLLQNMSGGTITAVEWQQERITLCRVCATLLCNPSPIFTNESLGGLDLAAIIDRCERVRVWEMPASKCPWASSIWWHPAVAVKSLNTRYCIDKFRRNTLIISIRHLEELVGRLYKVEECLHPFQFKSETVQVCLEGFNEASLTAAQAARLESTKLKWNTDQGSLVIPVARFGGVNPSHLSVISPGDLLSQVRSLLGFNQVVQVKNSKSTLGQLINGSELMGDYIGLMVECI